MKAIAISKPGGPDVLQWVDRDQPTPRAKEVLIKVVAAGVNRPDVAQRKGHYPPPPGASVEIPGLEISGIVAATGQGCERWKIGDQVCALVSGGGYAEYCVAPEGQCLPIPAHVTPVDAASLPETYFTVWHNVFQRAALKNGETLLVHGGAGGIGVTAIQLGRAHGAFVLITAGSESKLAFASAAGASAVINYKTENFKEVIKGHATHNSADVILDMVGGEYMEDNIDCLAEDGRIVIINYMKGDTANVRLSQLIRKRLTLTGSALRPRSVEFKSALARDVEKNIWPLFASGALQSMVTKTFPMSEAADAHRWMEGDNHMGKIILTTSK